jgi:hypothetical protein
MAGRKPIRHRHAPRFINSRQTAGQAEKMGDMQEGQRTSKKESRPTKSQIDEDTGK